MHALSKWNPFSEMEKWNPFKEMEEMQDRLATWLHSSPVRRGDHEEAMTVAEWAPVVDIIEDEKEYLIKAELPELKKEEVKVSVENGVLAISGERKFEKEEKSKRYHRVERAYGSFRRCFTVPEDADGAKVTAEFKEGLLRVHLPKNEKAAKKAIDVKIA